MNPADRAEAHLLRIGQTMRVVNETEQVSELATSAMKCVLSLLAFSVAKTEERRKRKRAREAAEARFDFTFDPEVLRNLRNRADASTARVPTVEDPVDAEIISE
jgi:hypothetical protein